MKKLFKQILCLSTTAFVLYSCGTVPEEATMTTTKKSFSIEEAFEIVAKENDVARTLYTKAIVGAGKKVGFKFDEDWEKDDIKAGPLPALFLRGISSHIRTTEVPLGLYLGSDFPIRKSNKFTGKQAQLFEEIRSDSDAKFFYDDENQLHTSMFPDFAGAQACVTCHNDHKETTKSDWKLGDIMGATTWTYPKDSLTYKEVAEIVKVYREGAIVTYNKFIEETKSFDEQPQFVGKWPSAGGYFLPTAEEFVDSVGKLASAETMSMMLKL